MQAEFSKVYCKEDYYFNSNLKFKKGKYYDSKQFASSPSKNSILIRYDNTFDFIAGSCMIFELIKPDYNSKEYQDFCDKYGPIGTAGPVYDYFVDYFVSKKELRKLKLERIANV